MREFHKAAISLGMITVLGTILPFAQVELSLAQPKHRSHKISKESAPCKAALKWQQSSLSLSYNAFDQTPQRGWRYLSHIKCYREAAELIMSYLNTKTKLSPSDIEILSFHTGQMLAYDNDYKAAIPFFKKSYQGKEVPLEFKAYGDAWNAYVNATIAFLEQDKPALEAYHAQVAAGPKMNNGQVMNLNVVERLMKNFGKPYRQAYGGR